jgi:hypothetical protein
MSQLTRKNMNRVYDELDKTRFSSAAFDIEFPESGITFLAGLFKTLFAINLGTTFWTMRQLVCRSI